MPIKTPVCDFGKKAENFELKSTENKLISLNDIKGENGTLIMFICNHCPYVKAIIRDVVEDCTKLSDLGINSVAICSNDPINYPEDSFEKMIEFAIKHKFNFPYLIDETQDIARKYDAVCTPDFFGYDKDFGLQYRGRIRELRELKPVRSGESDLFIYHELESDNYKNISAPLEVLAALGCEIKPIFLKSFDTVNSPDSSFSSLTFTITL